MISPQIEKTVESERSISDVTKSDDDIEYEIATDANSQHYKGLYVTCFGPNKLKTFVIQNF